jgi:hypothetical protein
VTRLMDDGLEGSGLDLKDSRKSWTNRVVRVAAVKIWTGQNETYIVNYPISERGPSPIRPSLYGSFPHWNPVVQVADRPSSVNPFANLNNSLVGGSLIGYLACVCHALYGIET